MVGLRFDDHWMRVCSGRRVLTRRLRLLSIGSRFESTEHIAHAELSLLTMLAMLTFTASERLGFSGIASLFVCGALTRHYTYHNLSPEAQAASMTLFLTLATMCETGLSTLLGVAVFDYLIWFHGGLFGMRFTLATLTIPTLFVSRALNIFPLTALVNRLRRGRKGEISIEMQIVMWFSGMRGALSFALAVTLSRGLPQSLAHDVYHQLVAATLFTITVTTLLMAPATRPLIRVLKVGAPTDLQKPFLPNTYPHHATRQHPHRQWASRHRHLHDPSASTCRPRMAVSGTAWKDRRRGTTRRATLRRLHLDRRRLPSRKAAPSPPQSSIECSGDSRMSRSSPCLEGGSTRQYRSWRRRCRCRHGRR